MESHIEINNDESESSKSTINKLQHLQLNIRKEAALRELCKQKNNIKIKI